MYPEVLNVYEMSEAAYSNGGDFPVSVRFNLHNRSVTIPQHSCTDHLAKESKACFPSLRFIMGFLHSFAHVSNPSSPVPTLYDIYYICTVCTKQALRQSQEAVEAGRAQTHGHGTIFHGAIKGILSCSGHLSLSQKEPLLKYIGITNAVFDRFFF